MYRRRRPVREVIAFGFDSFLDVVANVIGIIIRLILVAWVGARAYHAAMVWVDEAPEAKTAQVRAGAADPLAEELAQAHKDLDAVQAELRRRLDVLDKVESENRQRRQVLGQWASRRQAAEEERKRQDQTADRPSPLPPPEPPDLVELHQRSQRLLDQVEGLAKQPSKTKELRYQAPVSRTVEGDELLFECKAGRVAFIDLPAFQQEISAGLEDKAEALKSQWKVEAQTAAVGPFRLRYLVERQPELGETPAAKPRGANYRYGLTEWTVEPVQALRGETNEEALRAGSKFRQLIDGIDPQFTVVTFWVYPDSFGLFRQLRDLLHARNVEVAGRPLPMEAPIRASRYGTRSRGQ